MIESVIVEIEPYVHPKRSVRIIHPFVKIFLLYAPISYLYV